MSPFQRARYEALEIRKSLAPGRSSDPLRASELLAQVEPILNIAIESVAPGYPDLGGGVAVLQRFQSFIYVSTDIPEWEEEFCGLVAHELGHWRLDAEQSPTAVAQLTSLAASTGSPGVAKVEAYGARERQELLANVFARELLLPRDLAQRLAAQGWGPRRVANELGIPLEFARQQLLDAMLLPDFVSPTNVLHAPSEDQRRAAQATERFANVVAGPGTGKTSTLIHRVRHLIEDRHVDPGKILVLTFTNKAALELTERLRNAGISSASEIWAGTFHAFGLEFLRKYHQYFGLQPDVQVADPLMSVTALATALPELDLEYYLRVQDPYDWLVPVVEAITRLKEELVSPDQYLARVEALTDADDELRRRRRDVAKIYRAHEALLRAKQQVDFVDLIAKPALAIDRDRAPYAELADKFQYLLVDEYQDVTQCMVELLRQLAHKATSLWVVGDIRQAIHHWRGASLKSLLKFDDEFRLQAGGARIGKYPLEFNRRSHEEILSLIHQVGRQHALQAQLPLDEMKAKNGPSCILPVVVTCAKQADLPGAVLEGIRALQGEGVEFGNQTVLCRGRADVQRVADFLASSGVPVVFIGELSQRPEIKRLLCLMQLLVERRPRALAGLLDVPALAMSPADFDRIMHLTDEDVMLQRGRWLNEEIEGLAPAGQGVVASLRHLLAPHTHSSNPWSFVCDLLLEHRFGLPAANDQSVAAWVIRLALWQFCYSVRNGDGDIKQARLSRFLLRHRLRQRIGDFSMDRELPPEASALNGVRIQTVHASKGLEYDAVHLAFATANNFGAQRPSWSPPNIQDIVPPEVLNSSTEEFEHETAVERNNLLYVALSRAKRRLHIYQDDEYQNNPVPQLKHPQPFRAVRLSAQSRPSAPAPLAKDQESALAAPLPFDRFKTFAICALQYWYTYTAQLGREEAMEPAMRARAAIMNGLRQVASDGAAVDEGALASEWATARLPTATEDPTLWRDAQFAYGRGLQLISQARTDGGRFIEPVAIVADVGIQLPWGFMGNSGHISTFQPVRFARQGVHEVIKLLRPLVVGLPLPGTKTMQLRYVLSDESDPVNASGRVESTDAFKAAVRLRAGDISPTRGRHCSRCAFQSICPGIPVR